MASTSTPHSGRNDQRMHGRFPHQPLWQVDGERDGKPVRQVIAAPVRESAAQFARDRGVIVRSTTRIWHETGAA